MTRLGFARAISRYIEDEIFVIELDNGHRIMVDDQKSLLILGDFIRYVDQEFISNYFEVGSVTRIMGWESLPDIDTSNDSSGNS